MPEIGGWVAPGWEGVRDAFQHNFDSGKEVGAAFSAYHRGDKVVDLWGGIADEESGRPWEEDTLALVFSTTKGITAMCANKLAGEGSLDVDAPVSEYWPEFAQAGKETVTVSDLLAHRSGLAWTDKTMSLEEALEWDPVIRALEVQAPSWKPGTAHGYHATTFGWLVGEVVRRISGRSLGTYLRDEVTEPIGADFFIGLPAELESRVATLLMFSMREMLEVDTSMAIGSGEGDPAPVKTPEEAALAELIAKYLGRDGPLVKALTSPGRAFTDESIWNSRPLHAAEVPAANGITDARSLALLYASCIGEVKGRSGDPVRTVSSKQLDRALLQETEGPDEVLMGLDLQWGLGFMLNKGLIAAGGMAGPRAFGHFGMGGSVGWADPDLELAMGYVMNKMALGTTGDSRSFKLVQASVGAAKQS